VRSDHQPSLDTAGQGSFERQCQITYATQTQSLPECVKIETLPECVKIENSTRSLKTGHYGSNPASTQNRNRGLFAFRSSCIS
jgi:hypothetical protein